MWAVQFCLVLRFVGTLIATTTGRDLISECRSTLELSYFECIHFWLCKSILASR